MNENVLGFIKWAAGIVITLAIISIAFVVFNMAKDGTMKGTAKIEAVNAQMADSDVTMYDAAEVSGSAVVNAIKYFSDNYLGVQVNTGKSTGIWYGHVASIDTAKSTANITGDASASISNAIDEKNTQYINPNGRFMGKVYRDANGTIAAIVFTQK